MASFDWKVFLSRWSREIIECGEFADELPPEAVATGWLGYPPATEEEIAAAEARLAVRFPPSYREFLKVSNGWRRLSHFVHGLWSTEEVQWYIDQDPESVEIWTAWPDDEGSDEAYRVYGEEAEQPARMSYLRGALAISDPDGDGDCLLNPVVLSPDGEWEAWFLAPWVPGARRYRSFQEMLQEEYESFRSIIKSSRGEPTPRVDASLGIDAEDLQGLIGALSHPSEQQRLRALEGLGNLRDRRAFEVLLAIFENPNETLTVRQRAAYALGELRDPRAVQPLIDTFRPRPAAEGPGALAAFFVGMEEMPGSEWLRGLDLEQFLALGDDILGESMGRLMRNALAPESLAGAVADGLHHSARGALLTLGELALPALREALHDPEPIVRAEVANTLCYMRRAELFDVLVPLLQDPEPTVRASVAAHIEQLFDPRTLEPLLGALEDPDPRVRSAATTSLSALYRYLPDDRILDGLARAQQDDPDPTVRARAREARGQLVPLIPPEPPARGDQGAEQDRAP